MAKLSTSRNEGRSSCYSNSRSKRHISRNKSTSAGKEEFHLIQVGKQ